MNKATTLSIKNINSIEKKEVGDGKNFSAHVGKFGALFGMKGIGCGVVELSAGKKAWPYHLHYGQEELFVILEGTGTIRYDGELHTVVAGDVIYIPPGDGTAHQIINTSSESLQYLALSTTENPELCYYPDSGKYGSYVSMDKQAKKAFIAHESNAVDYFDGE